MKKGIGMKRELNEEDREQRGLIPMNCLACGEYFVVLSFELECCPICHHDAMLTLTLEEFKELYRQKVIEEEILLVTRENV